MICCDVIGAMVTTGWMVDGVMWCKVVGGMICEMTDVITTGATETSGGLRSTRVIISLNGVSEDDGV